MSKFCIISVLVLFATNSGGTPISISETDPMLVGGYFEGDMRFPQGVNPYSGIIGDNYRWPNKRVPYETDPAFNMTELALIRNAMTEIESKTCIKFVAHSGQPDYVYIIRGGPNTGCWSSVGRISGRQELNLQDSPTGTCIRHGIIAHELLHAIGFYHEQSRTDRDDYVTINYDNIVPELRYNFEKYSADRIYDQGVPYDFNSLMHYEAYSFAIDPTIPTIITTNGEAIGQRAGLSSSDSLKIRRMYKC